jgi:endoglucanase
MLSKSLAAVALLATNAAATTYYAGVAESSGEFGVWSQTSTAGTGLPGVFAKTTLSSAKQQLIPTSTRTR